MAMALDSGDDDGHHDCDDDSDSDMLDCCSTLKYQHLVQRLVRHDHVRDPMNICYYAFEMTTDAVGIDDVESEFVIYDRQICLVHDTCKNTP